MRGTAQSGRQRCAQAPRADQPRMRTGKWLYANIVGRIKDVIIRSGENVYPREIEEFLFTDPDIAEVQVGGVPDAKYGEEVMAWIKLTAGADPGAIKRAKRA